MDRAQELGLGLRVSARVGGQGSPHEATLTLAAAFLAGVPVPGGAQLAELGSRAGLWPSEGWAVGHHQTLCVLSGALVPSPLLGL